MHEACTERDEEGFAAKSKRRRRAEMNLDATTSKVVLVFSSDDSDASDVELSGEDNQLPAEPEDGIAADTDLSTDAINAPANKRPKLTLCQLNFHQLWIELRCHPQTLHLF